MRGLHSAALTLALLILPAGALFARAFPALPVSPAPSDPWTLSRNLGAAATLEVVAPDDLWASGLGEAAAELEATGRWRVVREPATSSDSQWPRMVFGLLGDPAIRGLIEGFGADYDDVVSFPEPEPGDDEPAGFIHAGRRYKHSMDALVATFEDPQRPGLPLTVYAAWGPRTLSNLVGDLTPVWRPGLTTFRRGRLQRQIALSGRARRDAALERGIARDTYELRARQAAGTGYRAQVLGPVDAGAGGEVDLGDYGRAVERSRRSVLTWIRADGGETRAPPARLIVYNDARTWVDLRGALTQYEVEGRALRAHVLLDPPLPHDGGAAAAEVVARATLGPPQRAWLAHAVGLDGADTWWGRPLEDWVAFLEQSGNVLSARELVSRTIDSEASPHVVDPLRAFLVRHLREQRGPASLRALWRGEVDLEEDLVELERSFRSALESNLETHAEELAAARAARRAATRRPRFRNGIALRPGTHGFANRGLHASLSHAAQLGADDIALHVFSHPAADERDFATDPTPRDSASVTDAELLRAAFLARSLGLNLLLQPHRVVSASGGLSGALHLGATEHVDAFFADLEASLIHYALVAELAGCEMLSVGAGLSNATLTGGEWTGPLPKGGEDEPDGSGADLEEPLPDEEPNAEDEAYRELRRAGWGRLTQRLRATFDGALTYAAQRGGRGWGAEALQFALWSDFDYVGVDLFDPLEHPLRRGERPRRSELERRLQGAIGWVCSVGREVARPALVTSIGFSSTAESWRRPWLDAGELDLATQAQMYAVIASSIPVLRRAESNWIGFYLWDWSADPNAGGTNHRGFTPQGKPAEDSLPAILKH